LWALAFLKIIRHSSLFNASTPLVLYTQDSNVLTHTFFPSQFWSSHFPCSIWLVLNIFLMILFSLVCIKCPAHSSLLAYIYRMMPGLLNSLLEIWGFHGGDYEEWCLLGCYAVSLL
jgi:hypothetical protein